MAETAQGDQGTISWQASEYIHHEKSAIWYAYFVLTSFAVIAGTWFILTDVLSVIIVTLMIVMLAIFAFRKPRVLSYSLTDTGVTIEGREYPYRTFKSFSVMQYGAVESIYLEPIERFMPAISLYFAPDDADKIVNTFSAYLPHRPRELDFVDRVVHRIRL